MRSPRNRNVPGLGGAGLVLVAALLLPTSRAVAQQQLPGLIVTVPSASAPPVPPPAAAPPAVAPPAAAPKAKPKPEPKATEKKRPAQSANADSSSGAAGAGSGTARAALKVNGEPITTYEIDQRARLLSMQSNLGQIAQERMKNLAASQSTNDRWRQIVEQTVSANQGKSRDEIMKILEVRRAELGASLQKQALESARASVLPSLKETAKKELIEETIKLQEARKSGVKVEEAEVEAVLGNLGQQNKMNIPQLEKHFGGLGVDLATLRAKFRANLAWAEVIRRKYSYLVNPNQRDIDKLVAGSSGGEDEVELQLQRILISAPAKVDQKNLAQRFVEAEALRREFKSCKSMAVLTNKVQGSRFETLGARRPGNFQEPTKSMLVNAKVEEMLPPNLITQGIELLAVCGRKVIKADEKRRLEAAAEIRQREFEILARRLLRDLQQEAIVE